MSISTRHIALSLALALPVCGISMLHAQSAGNLQQRMSSDEFKAAGLDKLSPQELQNLDSWLNAHAKVTTKVIGVNGQPVFYPNPAKRSKILDHIAGHFSGWQGNNEYKLDNGQVWKQNSSDSPLCLKSDHPSVKVKPSLFGNWTMYVSGCNGDAEVVRMR